MECLNPAATDNQPADSNESSNPRSQKRKLVPNGAPKAKRLKMNTTPKSTNGACLPSPKKSLTLKLGPRPAEEEDFPCCLCVSTSREGLLKVHDPPLGNQDPVDGSTSKKVWLAHEDCAKIVPETWVDELEDVGDVSKTKEKVVFGVDAIVKDRWNLVRKGLICKLLAVTSDSPLSIVPRVRSLVAKYTALLFSARKANARRPFTFLVHEMGKSKASYFLLYEKSRRTSSYSTKRLKLHLPLKFLPYGQKARRCLLPQVTCRKMFRRRVNLGFSR
jgi:hypothetical protein